MERIIGTSILVDYDDFCDVTMPGRRAPWFAFIVQQQRQRNIGTDACARGIADRSSIVIDIAA